MKIVTKIITVFLLAALFPVSALAAETQPQAYGDIRLEIDGQEFLPGSIFDGQVIKSGSEKKIVVVSNYPWTVVNSASADGEVSVSPSSGDVGRTEISLSFIKGGNVSLIFEEQGNSQDRDQFNFNITSYGNLILRYENEAGEAISPDEIKHEEPSWFWYDLSGETPKDISGYAFSAVKAGSAPLSGSLGEGTKVITYVYKKIYMESSITIRYVDENGNEIQQRQTVQGLVGNDYLVEPAAIDGFAFKEIQADSEPIRGKFSAEPQVVTLVYSKLPNVQLGHLLIRYVDEEGNEIQQRETIHGLVGSDYLVDPAVIDGFAFKEVQADSDSAQGQFSAEPQSVTFVYSKLPNVQLGHLLIRYVDEEGNEIQQRETIHGLVSSDYLVEPTAIDGFAFKEVQSGSDPVQGRFGTEFQTVTFVYAKLPNVQLGHLLIKYVDEDGNEIQQRQTIHGLVGSDYLAEPATIDGFAFKEVQADSDPAQGQFSTEPQSVTFVYSKLPNVQLGNLLIRYVDENGNEIQQRETIHGLVSSEYLVEPTAIEGFTFKEIQADSDPAQGQFSAEPQSVTFVYSKLPNVQLGNLLIRYVDENGKEIQQSQTLNGPIGEGYDVSSDQYKLSIDGYVLVEEKLPNNMKGAFTAQEQTVTFIYKKIDHPIVVDEGTVTTNYLDENGESLAPSNTQTGQIGQEYTTTEKNISGYELMQTKLPENAAGSFTKEPITVNYIYAKQQNSAVTDKATPVPSNKQTGANHSSTTYPKTGEHTSLVLTLTGLSLLSLAGLLIYKRKTAK
ncbi:MucBP domain-containing protein [Enterococcus sp. AZ072]|uniref:MucBP domain-containing protein n=1 Tax=unclassified Enterococcus TaxID=2608891 RepID=UPI003D28E202